MNDQTQIDLNGIFVAPATPTFAELLEQIAVSSEITPRRRGDMASGLKKVAAALGRTPDQVLADPRWLQPRLARITPATLSVSKKTWQNTLSNARSAMVACGIVSNRHRRLEDLSPAWRDLWEQVRASKDKSLLSPLPRFVFFLDRIGVLPDAVRDCHAELYYQAVQLNEITKDPIKAYKQAIAGWNLAIERLPGWPRQRLRWASRARRIMLPEADYAPEFIADLDGYLAKRMRPDVLLGARNIRRISGSSAQTYRYILLRFVSHVVASGVFVRDIRSLADLLEPEKVERGLRHMLEANDGETNHNISDTARLLAGTAHALNLPEGVCKALDDFKQRLARKDPGGMTPKNRDRLRALRAPGVLGRLLRLPEQIMQRPLGRHCQRGLRARESAIAIAILLYCPLRVSNLAALEIDRHLQRPGKGKMYVVLPASEVKNDRFLEFELPPLVVTMIESHLAERAPHLCSADCPYLFPALHKPGPVSGNTLSERIKKMAKQEIGVAMNAHLFRHLAVMIYLDANPGGYEVARQMLGHSSVSRTIEVYSGMESISATKALSIVVDRLRQEA